MPFKHDNTVFFISGGQCLYCHVKMSFGALSGSFVLMLYILNIRIIMEKWYIVKYSTERAFQYIEKHGETNIGVPVLEMKQMFQPRIYIKNFVDHLVLVIYY